jgi:hypothetical protein
MFGGAEIEDCGRQLKLKIVYLVTWWCTGACRLKIVIIEFQSSPSIFNFVLKLKSHASDMFVPHKL